MHVKSVSFISVIILLILSLAACSGAAPTVTSGDLETVVAITMQALTSHPIEPSLPASSTEPPLVETTVPSPAVNVPVPPLIPTATPVQVQPKGSFIPYPADSCESLRATFEQSLGAPVVVETALFNDRITGGSGTACHVLSTGTGADYAMVGGPLGTLMTLLPTLGWTEDNYNYGAAGPTGMATGYHKGGALGLLSVMWHPSEDANCPKDQPISACPLTPEQKIYDITFDAADMVIYNPPTEEQCASALAVIQPVIPIPLKLEMVDFTDFEMKRGFACQVRAEGNGLTFSGVGETANAIDAVLTPLGWTLGNGADGPTGTGREYTLGDLVAIVFVQWKPAADANCSKDQPISMCPLTPGQKLYTVTVTFGQK